MEMAHYKINIRDQNQRPCLFILAIKQTLGAQARTGMRQARGLESVHQVPFLLQVSAPRLAVSTQQWSCWLAVLTQTYLAKNLRNMGETQPSKEIFFLSEMGRGEGEQNIVDSKLCIAVLGGPVATAEGTAVLWKESCRRPHRRWGNCEGLRASGEADL